MGTWTCTILTKCIRNAIQWQTLKHNTQLLHLAMIVSKDTSYQDIYIFYTTFQLVYIYWLYKVIYIYMNIKCKNKNTYSEGMALKCCMWQHACRCTRALVCGTLSIYNMAVWIDYHIHTHTHRLCKHTHWIWPRLDWRHMKFNPFPARQRISDSTSFVDLQYVWVCAISWVIQIQLIWTAEKTS